MDLSRAPNRLTALPLDVRRIMKSMASDRFAPTPAARAIRDHISANTQTLHGAWGGETPIFWITPLMKRPGNDGYYVGEAPPGGLPRYVDSDLVLLSEHAHIGLRTWRSLTIWRMGWGDDFRRHLTPHRVRSAMWLHH